MINDEFILESCFDWYTYRAAYTIYTLRSEAYSIGSAYLFHNVVYHSVN